MKKYLSKSVDVLMLILLIVSVVQIIAGKTTLDTVAALLLIEIFTYREEK